MVVELTSVQEERLQHLAAETNRSPRELVQEGFDYFLAYKEDIRATVKRGRDDIAAGRLIPHDEVFAEIDQLLAGE
jgi:predicted transcriptional regulator